jgi:phenylacetate-CoA ligase
MSVLGSFYRNLALTPACFLRGRHYIQRFRFLQGSQWWSADELQAFQWAELTKLLSLAARTVPYYRELFQNIGLHPEDVKSWEDYRRIPALTRADVLEYRDQLSPAGLRSRDTFSHATGGSSGIPVRFYCTMESYDWRIAVTRRAYGWSGFFPGEPSVNLWGAPVGRQSRVQAGKVAVARWLSRTVQIPTFLQNEALWQRVYSEIRQKKPQYISGYVSSLLAFARFLEERGLQPGNLKAVIGAAEAMEDNTRDFLSKVYRAPVFRTYGSREFMSIAAECACHDGLHVNSENLLVETEDPLEPSNILITDLHNTGTVFLRYAIGDLGTWKGGPCQCGRGLPRLSTVHGRALDTLTLADGRRISCIFFRHILKDIPEILAYQVKQTSSSAIELRTVLSGDLSPQSQHLLNREMKKVLGDTQVALRRVSELESSKSGKVKVVIALNQ